MKNVIIYGYTQLGAKIANILLEKEYKVFVVDYIQENLDKALKDGFDVYNYSLLNDNELIDIGIGSIIDTLFCISESSKNNLFVTFSTRNIDKKIKIISTSETKAESKKLIIAGATKVLNPNELGALRIFRHLTKPLMLTVLDDILFSKSDLNISEIYVSKISKINGIYLNDFRLHKEFNILLLGIMDRELSNKFIFNTKGINHKIDEGDVLVVVGNSENMRGFKSSIEGVLL